MKVLAALVCVLPSLVLAEFKLVTLSDNKSLDNIELRLSKEGYLALNSQPDTPFALETTPLSVTDCNKVAQVLENGLVRTQSKPSPDWSVDGNRVQFRGNKTFLACEKGEGTFFISIYASEACQNPQAVGIRADRVPIVAAIAKEVIHQSRLKFSNSSVPSFKNITDPTGLPTALPTLVPTHSGTNYTGTPINTPSGHVPSRGPTESDSIHPANGAQLLQAGGIFAVALAFL